MLHFIFTAIVFTCVTGGGGGGGRADFEIDNGSCSRLVAWTVLHTVHERVPRNA